MFQPMYTDPTLAQPLWLQRVFSIDHDEVHLTVVYCDICKQTTRISK